MTNKHSGDGLQLCTGHTCIVPFIITFFEPLTLSGSFCSLDIFEALQPHRSSIDALNSDGQGPITEMRHTCSRDEWLDEESPPRYNAYTYTNLWVSSAAPLVGKDRETLTTINEPFTRLSMDSVTNDNFQLQVTHLINTSLGAKKTTDTVGKPPVSIKCANWTSESVPSAARQQ